MFIWACRPKPLVGVALPLTLFTGASQLTTVIHDAAALGAGLIIAVVFAKILTFALCQATGFIGGLILMMLFIGGTAGIAAHLLIPGLPEGLAFAAMSAAILGSLVAAPFTLIVLVALTARIGRCSSRPWPSWSSRHTSPFPALARSWPWHERDANPSGRSRKHQDSPHRALRNSRRKRVRRG
ncbi:MAG TPA: chloride channel protein, partial [Streptosporangiaceae bacterium]